MSLHVPSLPQLSPRTETTIWSGQSTTRREPQEGRDRSSRGLGSSPALCSLLGLPDASQPRAITAPTWQDCVESDMRSSLGKTLTRRLLWSWCSVQADGNSEVTSERERKTDTGTLETENEEAARTRPLEGGSDGGAQLRGEMGDHPPTHTPFFSSHLQSQAAHLLVVTRLGVLHTLSPRRVPELDLLHRS